MHVFDGKNWISFFFHFPILGIAVFATCKYAFMTHFLLKKPSKNRHEYISDFFKLKSEERGKKESRPPGIRGAPGFPSPWFRFLLCGVWTESPLRLREEAVCTWKAEKTLSLRHEFIRGKKNVTEYVFKNEEKEMWVSSVTIGLCTEFGTILAPLKGTKLYKGSTVMDVQCLLGSFVSNFGP